MAEPFQTISNLQRKPSTLSVLQPNRLGSRRLGVGSSSSCSSSPSGEERGVQTWGRQEVADWLAEISMKQYQVR